MAASDSIVHDVLTAFAESQPELAERVPAIAAAELVRLTAELLTAGKGPADNGRRKGMTTSRTIAAAALIGLVSVVGCSPASARVTHKAKHHHVKKAHKPKAHQSDVGIMPGPGLEVPTAIYDRNGVVCG